MFKEKFRKRINQSNSNKIDRFHLINFPEQGIQKKWSPVTTFQTGRNQKAIRVGFLNKIDMSDIKNLEGLTVQQINTELDHGAKFVVFEYCISIIVMTFRRSSDIYFIKAGESTIKHSIGLTILTLIIGWWGIPWGPIYTIGSLYTNLSGGKDVTLEVLNSIDSQ